MNERIKELAKQAGWGATSDPYARQAFDVNMFAHLVRAAALDEAAETCDAEARQHEHLDRNGRSRHLDDAQVAKTCAANIRRLKEPV